ncbi:MAG TPA: YajD family HNH nuclease [Burkholderiales bacterium]|nr:YajD family HNH nuclease [Burkholderiales bacterium]
MAKLDDLVAQARKAQQERALSYREQALKILPWICGRCAREFGRERLRELTVHHKDGNHDNNPPDGSNWELLCVYCHENEHARVEDSKFEGKSAADSKPATHRAFQGLDELLKKKKK